MKNNFYNAAVEFEVPYEEEISNDRVFDNDDYSGTAVTEENDSYGFYPDTSF